MQTAAYKQPNLITSTFSAKHSQLMAAHAKALSPLIFHLSSSHLAHRDIEGHNGGIFPFMLISEKLEKPPKETPFQLLHISIFIVFPNVVFFLEAQELNPNMKACLSEKAFSAVLSAGCRASPHRNGKIQHRGQRSCVHTAHERPRTIQEHAAGGNTYMPAVSAHPFRIPISSPAYPVLSIPDGLSS